MSESLKELIKQMDGEWDFDEKVKPMTEEDARKTVSELDNEGQGDLVPKAIDLLKDMAKTYDETGFKKAARTLRQNIQKLASVRGKL